MPHEKRLVVIDHNLAFDPEFDERSFFDNHIFSMARERIFGDLVMEADYKKRMERALSGFQVSVDTILETWPWLDLEETRPFQLGVCRTYAFEHRIQ